MVPATVRGTPDAEVRRCTCGAPILLAREGAATIRLYDVRHDVAIPHLCPLTLGHWSHAVRHAS